MRPTTPACAGPRRAKLATHLAALREAVGLTFTHLAELVELSDGPAVSAATLKRAARCETVPKESTVLAYVRACGADTGAEWAALQLWRAARGEERGVLARLQAPSVSNIRTPADLTAALAAAYERAGAPPLRTLQQRAGTDNVKGDSVLPLGSAWRIIHREAHPADWPQCAAFLRGCGIHHRRIDQWHQAWTRATTNTPPAPSRATRTGPKATMELSFPRSAQAMALGRLSPQGRSTVLAAGFVHLLDTEARRNGTTPEIRFDHIQGRNSKIAIRSAPPSTDTTDLLDPLYGLGPDTGIDAIAVHDGQVHLVQAKWAPYRPGGPAAGHPAVPPQPDNSPTRAASRRHRTPEPVPA